MSCNTKTSLAAVIDAVNAQLNNNYVDRDDPRINQGVFTEPTIRGGLMLDEAAKLDFCGYVTECGQREPFGKQWVDRPLYPNTILVSREDGGEVKSKWQNEDDVVAGTSTGKNIAAHTETIRLATGGFTYVDSFEAGGTLTQVNQALRQQANGALYRWAGSLPKIVPEGATPETSGGIGPSAWVEISYATVRDDILNNGLITDKLVRTTPVVPTAISRSQDKVNADTTHVKAFGMVGDGVTNNDTAILKAINSGKSLDWGGVDDVYKVTEQVSSTLTSNVNWTSNGATIQLETNTHQRCVVNIETQGFNVVIKGVLNVLANSKANVGVLVVNYLEEAEAANGYVYMRDVRVKDMRRADTTWGGGDGIVVYGPYASVILDRPSVENVVMAAGAGVSGLQGVSGISVSRVGAGSPRYIRIVDAYVDGIRSEDLDYNDDQDGIKIFTDVLDHEATAPFKGIAHIIGGTIKNSYGRGIKTQSDNCHISGTHFIRTEGVSRGHGNHEIDMQYGGGSISDIHIHYDGHRSNSIIACQPHKGTTLKNIVPITTVRGVKGTIINQPVGPMAYAFHFQLGLNTEPVIYLEDVNISSDLSGRISYLVLIASSTLGAGTGIRARFNINNVEMKVVSALIYQRDPVLAHINMNTVHTNYGTNLCKLVYASPGSEGYITLSTQRVTNVFKVARLDGTTDIATGLRLETIIPTERDYSNRSGLIKFISMPLPTATITNLGSYGITPKVFLAQVSIAFTGGTQVTLAGGGSTLAIIAPTTPDPSLITAAATKAETGRFRFFFDGDNLMVENNDTSARQITMMVVG